ncbi:MAG: DinB family protein [Bacillota bacterium]|nr:DinB family protein [Bacillota bacterium]
MFMSIESFITTWEMEGSSTQKILDALTDESLQQAVKPNDRTLGGIAWHLVTAIGSIVGETGLSFDAPGRNTTLPTSAKEIADAYRSASVSLLNAIKENWTDQSLFVEHKMFGQFDAPAGIALTILVNHQIHHRGQMTILMRQADLVVPGMYGPAKEEWSLIGMEPPEIK